MTKAANSDRPMTATCSEPSKRLARTAEISTTERSGATGPLVLGLAGATGADGILGAGFGAVVMAVEADEGPRLGALTGAGRDFLRAMSTTREGCWDSGPTSGGSWFYHGYTGGGWSQGG